jgi:uncharacterized protein involved in exopolysaccharide biosynthesis
MTSRELRPSIRTADAASRHPEPLSILGVTNVVLRNRRMVLIVILAVAVIAVLRSALAPRVYASSASFIPAGRKAPSPVSGIAAQFGISMPSVDGQQSPDFYVALLHSRTVQDQVLDTTYSFNTSKGLYRGTLLDYYGDPGRQLARRRVAALRMLDGQIKTATSLKTGAVLLTVRAHSPTLAADIARNLLAGVDRFNRARVQSQSASERQFAEEQVANSAGELRAAEDRLEAFQEENRAYDRAPRLTFDHERLVREVNMRQQLYTSLAQAYAQARIDAVRDNPSVVVLESPDVPPDPEPRGLVKTGLLALMAGLFLGVLLAFVREHIVRTRALHPEEEAEYATLRAAAARDLRNPFRLLGVRRRR